MLSPQKPEIAYLVLAAGASRRMGTPKQLLPWEESTFIETTITRLCYEKNIATYVVLGAHFELILPKIEHYPVSVINNSNWESGIGSSISLAVKKIKKEMASCSGILISTVDQPLIKKQHLKNLISLVKNNENGIAATDLGMTVGVPAVFTTSFFDELIDLDADHGAKYIIRNNKSNVMTIAAIEEGIDIDTEEQYRALFKP